MWLKAGAPDLMAGLEKIEEIRGSQHLAEAMAASGVAVEEMVSRGLKEGKVKGFKPHATAFVSYLISHEGHHRGQAELALRIAGVPISDKVSYGLWEWGVR